MPSQEKLYTVTGKVTITYPMSDERQTMQRDKVVSARDPLEAAALFVRHYERPIRRRSTRLTAHANRVVCHS